jgi:hypothetical protein
VEEMHGCPTGHLEALTGIRIAGNKILCSAVEHN